MAIHQIHTSMRGRQFGMDENNGLLIADSKVIATATVTTAQVLALNATAIEVVPAPGAGLALVPTLVVIYKAAGTAYAGVATGEDLVLKYTDASGAQCSSAIETTGFLDQTTAETRYAGMPGAITTTAASVEPVANAAVMIHLLSGEITTGDSDLIIRTYCEVIQTVLS